MIHRLGLSFIVWRQKAQRGAGLTLCTGWRSKICLDMCSTFPALIFACCSVIVEHNLSLECAQNFVFAHCGVCTRHRSTSCCTECAEWSTAQSFHVKHISLCTKAMAAPWCASHEDARRMIIITLVIVLGSDYQQPARIMRN